MAEILQEDFTEGLRQWYEFATAQRPPGVSEPEVEMTNALDHFARASEFASRVDSEANLSPEKTEHLKNLALTHLELGRRHLWFGRTYCVEHLIEWALDRLVDYLSDGDGVAGELHLQAVELEGHYLEIPLIGSSDAKDPEGIRVDTDRIRDVDLVALAQIMNGLFEVAGKLGAIPSRLPVVGDK